MKTHLFTLIAVAVVVQAGPPALAQQRSIPIEGYAAKVNDRVIMVSDVMAMVRSTEQRLRSTLSGDELAAALADAYQEAVDALVDRQLILEEYESKEGEIPPQAIEDQMGQILAERFGNDRSELLKSLQQQHLTYDEWRTQVEEQLIIAVMRRDAVFDKVSVPPNAARQRYEETIDRYRTPAEVKLRMILVNQGTTEEERAAQVGKIKDARSRIKFGETFAAVARDLSEGAKAANGGDRGWMPISDLRPELAKVVDQLKAGILSRVVAAGDFFYLMLVEERRDEIVVPFEDAREILEQELRRSEVERIQDEWTARLRKRHFVKIY